MDVVWFILIIIGIVFIYKKMSSTAESEYVNVDKVIQNYKNTGKKFIETSTLGKAAGVDASKLSGFSTHGTIRIPVYTHGEAG